MQALTALLARFTRQNRGTIAVLAAILISVVLLGVAGAVDAANALRVRDKTQFAVDRAALAAARIYRDGGDEQAAIRAGEQLILNSMSREKQAQITPSVTLTLDPDSQDVMATASAALQVKTLLLGIFDTDAFAYDLTATSELPNLMDLYVVMMMDATGSMQDLISSVQAAAVGLEGELRDRLAGGGILVDKIFVKAIYFRDLRTRTLPGLMESRPFDLSLSADQAEFVAFVNGEAAFGGLDWPESSLSALSHALTSDLPAGLTPDRVFQTFVLWTDASAIPLDDFSMTEALADEASGGPTIGLNPQIDDITVGLWKRRGALYRYAPGENALNEYDEDTEEAPVFNGDDKTRGRDGCCRSLAALVEEWANGGAVPLRNRRLGLFVNEDMYPWRAVADWPNVDISDYLNPTASSVVDDLYETIAARESPLRLTH